MEELKSAAIEHAKSILGEEQFKKNKEAVLSISEDFVKGAEWAMNHPGKQNVIAKAEKWERLRSEISKCYLNKEGEYDEKNPEIEGADLCTIGEMAASAFGWL